MDNKNLYSTTSLALATAIQLVSAGKLQFVDKSNPDRCEFVFIHAPDLEQIITLFWQKSLPVDAFSYFETLKFIKSRLYEQESPV